MGCELRPVSSFGSVMYELEAVKSGRLFIAASISQSMGRSKSISSMALKTLVCVD